MSQSLYSRLNTNGTLPLYEGSFGKIYFFRIKSSYFKDHRDYVAGKEITIGDFLEVIEKEIALLDLLGTLRHENIVSFLGHEEVNRGKDPAIPTMILYSELCRGSLESILQRSNVYVFSLDDLFPRPPFKRELLEALDFKAAVQCAIDICNGLQFVHSKEIMHRDLKPANILLGYDGRFKITDFGHSKEYVDGKSHSEGRGTRWYKAPETYTRHYNGKVADLYSLGVTFMELFFLFDATNDERKKFSTFRNRELMGSEKPRTILFPKSDQPQGKFSEMIEALMNPTPKLRWSLERVIATLKGEPFDVEMKTADNQQPEEDEPLEDERMTETSTSSGSPPDKGKQKDIETVDPRDMDKIIELQRINAEQQRIHAEQMAEKESELERARAELDAKQRLIDELLAEQRKRSSADEKQNNE